MGKVNYSEEIEERRTDDLSMFPQSSVPKPPATVSELRKHIKRLNAEIAALNNGDEISRLCSWIKGLQAENSRLEKGNAKLEKTIRNLNKDIQDLRAKLKGDVAKKSTQQNTESYDKKNFKSKAKPNLSNYLSKLNFQKNGDSKPKKRKRR